MIFPGRWRAWYADGAVYDSREGSWAALPETGLVVVVVYGPTGRTLYSGADWYWMEDGRIRHRPSGEWGTWRERPRVRCRSCVKRGDRVPDEVWRRLYEEALAWA